MAHLCRAAQLLQASNQQRLETIESVAREQCDAVGDADLRRLKRQFSSLKNTFLHYEVKQSFITGGCSTSEGGVGFRKGSSAAFRRSPLLAFGLPKS